jgi:hypothetical protein
MAPWVPLPLPFGPKARMFTAMTILLYQYSVCWRETPDAPRSKDMNEYSLKEEIGDDYIPKK